MIISNLNHLESVSESTDVVGGMYAGSSYSEFDYVSINFNSSNYFSTTVNPAITWGNSAAAGAKGDAINNTCFPTSSYTKADTVAVTEFLGGSLSASTSVAVINPYLF